MMNKTTLFLSFFLVFQASSGHSQDASGTQPFTEGTIRYLVTHHWTKKMASLDYVSKTSRERNAYIWGKNSEWQEYRILHLSPARTKYEDSEERPQRDDNGYSWRKDVFFTTRDFEQNTQYDAITLEDKVYLIEDSLYCQDWKILNDMKEVAGHVCMNAFWEDTLKKQKIVAWFALDLPHRGGPERYCGLPGLILEVDVNNGAFIVSADKMEAKPLSKEFELPKKLKGKKVNEAGYQNTLKKIIARAIKEEVPYFWNIPY